MKLIYKSEFTPNGTVKQAALFEADAKYADSKGYQFIESSDGVVFTYISGDLMQTSATADKIIADYEAFTQQIAEESENDDYCVECHNLYLIDTIINNTLKQADNITPQQADTMLKLAHLKQLLGGN